MLKNGFIFFISIFLLIGNLQAADINRQLYSDDINVVRAAIAARADVNSEDRWHVSPLMHALGKGNQQIAILLINTEGINLDAKNYEGITPLMDASLRGNIDIVELLIEKEADLDIKDDEGMTALMWASKEKHNRIIKLLVNAGADTALKNKDGRTAREIEKMAP